MPSSQPTVRANILTPLAAYLVPRRVDLKSLLEAAGLSRDDLRDEERRIGLVAACRTFELAAERCSDPCFGLHYAQFFPTGGTGVIGQVALTAPTVREALQAIARYMTIHNSIVTEFREQEGVGRLRLAWPAALTHPRVQFNGFLVMLIVERMRRGAGSDWRPTRVELEHRCPADIDEYQRLLGKNLHFGQPANEIVFNATALCKPMPQDIGRLHPTIRAVAEIELEKEEAHSDIRLKVRAALAKQLTESAPFDLDAIAKLLGLQPRSLQWQLEQHETSYERLLSETRKEMAEQMLRDTDLPLTAIAARLRFSELSAFTRAANRWFDMAPSAYRQRLRKGRAGSGP